MAGKFRKMTQKGERKRITIYVTPEYHKQIIEKADRDKHSISSVCEKIIEGYFCIGYVSDSEKENEAISE